MAERLFSAVRLLDKRLGWAVQPKGGIGVTRLCAERDAYGRLHYLRTLAGFSDPPVAA